MKRIGIVVVVVLATAGALLYPQLGSDSDGGVTSAFGDAGSAPGSGVRDESGRLSPALAHAFGKAQTAAAGEGVDLTITSGWRSAAKQQELYEEAIDKYGSPEVARQWVLPPDESEHVRGGAIDVGPPSGASWLERNGVRFGICRVYENEPWHFELLAPAKGQPCPALEPHA